MEAPRDDLIRATFGEADLGDGRTLTGYPIVFDTWTTIRSYEGEFRERIAPGALNRTLANNGDRVKVLFNHGMDPDIGEKPLGKPAVQQVDGRGLYVEVPLAETSYNDDILALLRAGALDGMSFRFSVVDETWDTPKRGLPERTITELKLYEYGPVTFPAYEATSVGIRSRDDFTAWQGMDATRHAEIARIMGTDLRTLGDRLADQHPDIEARDDETAIEPAVEHLEAPTSTLSASRRARQALRRERARALGVIQ